MIGLTNDNPTTTRPVYKKSYAVCAQYSGAVAAGETAVVTCSSDPTRVRYVVVHGSDTNDRQPLCLAEVEVYSRSKYCFLYDTISGVTNFCPPVKICYGPLSTFEPLMQCQFKCTVDCIAKCVSVPCTPYSR